MFQKIAEQAFKDELEKIAGKCKVFFSNPPIDNDLIMVGKTGSIGTTEVFFSKSTPSNYRDPIYH